MAVDWDHDQNTKHIQRIKLRNISLLFVPVHCDVDAEASKKKSSGKFKNVLNALPYLHDIYQTNPFAFRICLCILCINTVNQ